MSMYSLIEQFPSMQQDLARGASERLAKLLALDPHASVRAELLDRGVNPGVVAALYPVSFLDISDGLELDLARIENLFQVEGLTFELDGLSLEEEHPAVAEALRAQRADDACGELIERFRRAVEAGLKSDFTPVKKRQVAADDLASALWCAFAYEVAAEAQGSGAWRLHRIFCMLVDLMLPVARMDMPSWAA